MSKSTRKFVAGLLSIAMVLTLVVGLSATASAQTATYTRNLTVGSTGADVTALQTFLASKGFFTVTPTGYFGSITKRALAQYQASVGIAPAAGYFGPITRANLAGSVVVTPGTSVPGCPAGAVYNYMTGALCAGTSTPTTSGAEGTLTVTAAATPANNANIQTATDVPVYGLDLKAQIAPVTVSRIDLDVAVTNSGSVENPGNFVNAIKVWDGSTLVKSWAVGTADFITGASATDYYVRLSGINFTVTPGTTKTLTVSFSTNAGIDNSRTVTVVGYGTNSLLAISGNNINSYYNISGITRTHTFAKPGTATLTVGADSNLALSMTNWIDHNSTDAKRVTLQTFTVSSATGDTKITTVTARATSSASSNGPTALYLVDTANPAAILASWSAGTWTAQTAQTATFTLSGDGLVVAKDGTKTLAITADIPATITDATIASTTVASVSYTKPNGTSATVSSSISGNNQYFYSASPMWTLVNKGTPSVLTAGTAGSFNGLSHTFDLTVTPKGGTMTLPVASDFVVTVASSTTAGNITVTPASVTIDGNPTSLAKDATYTVHITTTVASTSLSAGVNTVWFKLTSAASSVGGTSTTQTWGLNNFQSNPVTYAK
ncbi:MAG: baaA1 [Candidatus Paceibacter sp.]|jgi:hypothetical protein|nr:baaA1 [Candidatus Paceibacter sp.]